MNVNRIAGLVDTAMAYRGENCWFIEGTRERAIEAGWNQMSKDAVVDALSQALSDGEIVWRGDDPHDPIGRR